MIPFKLASPNVIESEVYAGDTWRGFTLRGESDGDPTTDLPAVQSAKLQFYDSKGHFVWELNTETLSEAGLPVGWPDNLTGTITIDNAATWLISVNAQPLPLEGGAYTWDLETIDIINTKRTLLAGRISVCQDITQS